MGMIVTPFGGLKYQDEKALREWVTAHDVRHRLYQNTLMGQDELINQVPLDGKINKDWFGRHLLSHIALTAYLPNPVTTATEVLSGWDDEQSFYTWHDLHTLLHRQLDNQLNLT